MEQWQLQGDADSFRMLAERYAPMVFATGIRILRHALDTENAAAYDAGCISSLASKTIRRGFGKHDTREV